MGDQGDDARLFGSIELSPIATVVTCPRLPDNPIQAANAAFIRLTGYARAELIGRNCRLLAGRDSEPEATDLLRQAVAAARPAMTEILNYRKDGTTFRNAVMIAPIFDDAGRLAWFLGSQMDVSEGPAREERVRKEKAAARLAGLTRRQRQVLEHMALGLRNKQIAAEIGINEKTVKMHRAALLVRLGASTSADAVRLSVEAGL